MCRQKLAARRQMQSAVTDPIQSIEFSTNQPLIRRRMQWVSVLTGTNQVTINLTIAEAKALRVLIGEGE